MGVRIKLAWMLLGAIIFAIAVVNAANAGPYEEAIAANARGDYASAMRLLRPLAEQGHADAQSSLGDMYALGWGIPQDYPEAVKWYGKAADQGNASAHTTLGSCTATATAFRRTTSRQ